MQGKTWTFTVSVLGVNWLEVIGWPNGQREMLGGDGASVYWLLEDRPARHRLHSYAGNVFTGVYPLQSSAIYTTIPWLAYCSGDFLKKAATKTPITLPAPWIPAWLHPLAHIYVSKYLELEGGNGLPERLDYKPDPELMAALKAGHYRTMAPVSDTTREHVTIQLAAYYSKIDAPEAVYQVVQTTNYQGLLLPAQFVFENYTFRRSTNGNWKAHLYSKIDGKISSLRMINTVDPLPRLAGDLTTISVADYRFFDRSNGVGFISYFAKNSAWITNEADPYLQTLYSAAKTKSHRALTSTNLPRAVVFLLLTAAVTSPLLFGEVRRYLLGWFKQTPGKETWP